MNAILNIGQVSLLHHIEPSNHSVSNHPSSPPGPTWFCTMGLTVVDRIMQTTPTQQGCARRHLGFAIP